MDPVKMTDYRDYLRIETEADVWNRTTRERRNLEIPRIGLPLENVPIIPPWKPEPFVLKTREPEFIPPWKPEPFVPKLKEFELFPPCKPFIDLTPELKFDFFNPKPKLVDPYLSTGYDPFEIIRVKKFGSDY